METKECLILVIEDNPADARFIEELLAVKSEEYRILHAKQISHALEILNKEPLDVALLDLGLPDSMGVDSVKAIRAAGMNIPVIVFTQSDDEALALACIDAGAQDYLRKAELQSLSLRRAIDYSIKRHKESQLRELQETLERYRNLGAYVSREKNFTPSSPIAETQPNSFKKLVHDYLPMIDEYIAHLIRRTDKPKAAMEKIIARIGHLHGSPKDLLNVHITALDEMMAEKNVEQMHVLILQGRLIVLEMMGLLAEYYRTNRQSPAADHEAPGNG